jgi:hypothetical protein
MRLIFVVHAVNGRGADAIEFSNLRLAQPWSQVGNTNEPDHETTRILLSKLIENLAKGSPY